MVSNLYLEGSGTLVDMETFDEERVDFAAPIDRAHFVFSLGEELSEWNSVYPKITVNEVKFKILKEDIVVSLFGDLPLFLTH